MNNRLNSLHNKTQVVATGELPYNPENRLLEADDLNKLFKSNGLDGVKFNNLNLYRTAFVHRSYITMKNADFETGNERCPDDCLPLQEMSYERLEFLGDAILGAVIARYLYERFPEQDEGFLSMMRTKLVNGKMLGYLSEKIGLTPFVIISKQVEAIGGRTNFKILEDCFEAFIGALYTDFQQEEHFLKIPQMSSQPNSGCGHFIAEQWIIYIIENTLDFAELIASRNNFKDILVRHMQNTFQDSPQFFEVSVNTIQQTGQKHFTYNVRDRSKMVLGIGHGANRKEAENEAAKAALIRYGIYKN